MDPILVSSVLILLFGVALYKRNTGRKDLLIIWSIYFISIVSSIFYDPKEIPGFKERESYFNEYGVLYGCLLIYALSPLYSLNNQKKKFPSFETITISVRLKRLLLIAGVAGTYSFFYQLPFAIDSLSKGAIFIRTQILTQADETVLPRNLFTTAAVAISSFFPFYIAFLLISVKEKLKIHYRLLILLGSLSYVISSLCFAARDGILFYMIFVVVLLTRFWKSLDKKLKITISILLISLFTVGIGLLFTITKSRFGESKTGIQTGTIGYIAQQPYVFMENIRRRQEEKDFYGLSLRFPLISSLLGEKRKVIRTEPFEWTFGTFLTDFYNIYGFSSLFSLLILFTEFIKFQFNDVRNKPPINYLIIYIFYVHFIVSGLFYFRLGNDSGNIYIFSVITMFFLVKLKIFRV